MDVIMNKEKFFHFFCGLFLIIGIALKPSVIYSSQHLTSRPEVQSFIHQMVKNYGFNKHELTDILNHAVIQPTIIESITKPYEKKTWDIYKNIFIKPERIQEGIAFWQNNQGVLKLAEKKYGVPAPIIVAILGVETRYGIRQGEYRVLDALSTLAFNYPPRAPFFKKELGEFLLLCREHKVSPYAYTGSYAGAMGIPQFMPSSYRYYADDFSGQKKKDLMHDSQAAIASVGNYFKKHGWRLNEAVVQKAKISNTKFETINITSKKAEYSLKKLAKAGITPFSPTLYNNLPNKAGLVKLDTQTGHEYWIAYPNFYVITKYNTSPQYALVVYIFSEQLKQQWAKMHGFQIHTYS